MTSPRAGPGAPLPVLGDGVTGRDGERLAMAGRSIIRKGGKRRERADAIRAKDGRETRAKDDRNQQTEDRREEGTGEGVNGEAAEGRRGRRHPSPWFSLFVCCPFRSPFCFPRSFFLLPFALPSFVFPVPSVFFRPLFPSFCDS